MSYETEVSGAETAKTLEKSLTFDKGLVGTPCYMSPEAVRGDDPEPSFDLWGLGVTLFECLAGENPMLRPTLKDTLDRISTAPIPDIREFEPECPPELAGFFKKVLAQEQSRRIATAEDFSSCLRNFTLEQVAG
jgi:serine/threonine protein kinase